MILQVIPRVHLGLRDLGTERADDLQSRLQTFTEFIEFVRLEAGFLWRSLIMLPQSTFNTIVSFILVNLINLVNGGTLNFFALYISSILES